jgi:hypothetical protein
MLGRITKLQILTFLSNTLDYSFLSLFFLTTKGNKANKEFILMLGSNA